MEDLPNDRVKVSRVLTKDGIDYAGPFFIKLYPGKFKSIFICFAIKAIHLDIVTNCSTDAFIGALRRFISHRGKPHDIFSDNGTNFVGPNNELKKILQHLFIKEDKEKIENFIVSEGIVWHFNSPATPHFGGLWEADIKSLKSHLKRVIDSAHSFPVLDCAPFANRLPPSWIVLSISIALVYSFGLVPDLGRLWSFSKDYFLSDRVSLLRVYQALILSRLDYGCVVYGSARASVLKRLDTVHHSALRICSGAFRTSPVTSLYVVYHQPPLELRRRQLSANYFISAVSVPSHPLKPFVLAIGLNRLYEARSFNIKPFSGRAKAVLNDAHLNNINIQENNILAFPPWDIQIFNYHSPFSGYHKAGTADIIYQQLFSFHRSKYSKYVTVYTNGSMTAGHVGCGVVFNNTILNFTLHNSMYVFSAELTAILVALQHIIVSNHRHFCVYTDIVSALESLHFSTEHRHPTVIEILLLLRKLERKGFDIIFSWVPGHVGILGNEQADTAARFMSDHMQRPVCYQDLKTFTQNYIHRVWHETWDQQVLNKLHSIHPSTSHWAALPLRRHDVRLSRLRIGHTRFTH
ncbi:putative RNA-directed DNA polymerase from transposon X-element [Trichonephila clavipes]|uniref:Putative RNA-directed DNA polymerase from transposon X-element n=1 Tax=Trichonephila clavipes TaxID=2585209 RepID=A0A8X6RB77_TRICX|nr:putative RNA-directed DNA polymerase from transposon X-element [Trichonephila clavipes]